MRMATEQLEHAEHKEAIIAGLKQNAAVIRACTMVRFNAGAFLDSIAIFETLAKESQDASALVVAAGNGQVSGDQKSAMQAAAKHHMTQAHGAMAGLREQCELVLKLTEPPPKPKLAR
jgi:3-deoxy-D-manno-octulosonate 8-phosphate phosphatase KdsC-like HAD superfamily phosphatase